MFAKILCKSVQGHQLTACGKFGRFLHGRDRVVAGLAMPNFCKNLNIVPCVRTFGPHWLSLELAQVTPVHAGLGDELAPRLLLVCGQIFVFDTAALMLDALDAWQSEAMCGRGALAASLVAPSGPGLHNVSQPHDELAVLPSTSGVLRRIKVCQAGNEFVCVRHELYSSLSAQCRRIYLARS